MEKQELRLAQDYADENAVALEDVIEKIRAGELKGKIDDGVWYVLDETTKSQVSESAKDTVSDLNSDAAFFVKLSNGYYGLAKTFWLFGFVLATLLALLPFAIGIFMEQKGLAIVMFLFWLAYEFAVLLGTWRAAGRYGGPKIWAYLARGFVVYNWFQFALSFVLFI